MVVCFGSKPGNHVQYYDLPDSKVVLINGYNFYCNGSHCSNFKVIVLQEIKDNQVYAAVLDYPGVYPHTFGNIRIFRSKTDNSPSIYLVKSSKNGKQTEDFQALSLNDLLSASPKTAKLDIN